jgi:hypothetical protein
VLAVVFAAIGLARVSSLPPVLYEADDPVAPHGSRRSSSEIVRIHGARR